MNVFRDEAKFYITLDTGNSIVQSFKTSYCQFLLDRRAGCFAVYHL